MKETIGIKGKIVMIEHESNDVIDPIMEKFVKGEELTFDEETKLTDATTKTCTVDNTIMDRYMDRIVSLMGWAGGYQFDNNGYQRDDRAAMGNQLSAKAMIDSNDYEKWGTTLWNSWDYTYGMYPELIKVGWGETPPQAEYDTDLDEPFIDYDYEFWLGNREHKGWKNVYATKEGTIKPYTQKVTGGLDYTESYIARYATIYTTDDINALDHPIREVGLYFPIILTSYYPLQGTTVYFDMGGDLTSTTGTGPAPGGELNLFSHNKVWSVLNYSLSYGTNLATVDRYITDHDRGQQTLSLPNLESRIDVPGHLEVISQQRSWAIVTFTPHVEYICKYGGQGFGSSEQWPGGGSAGGLAARQVLPVSFMKNPNHALTVLWYIYFKIDDQD